MNLIARDSLILAYQPASIREIKVVRRLLYLILATDSKQDGEISPNVKSIFVTAFQISLMLPTTFSLELGKIVYQ